MLPPSLMELEARIMKRGTESPGAMAKRPNFALEEMKALDIYAYVVTNDRVEEAARKITAIRVAEKCAAGRNEALINKLLKEGTW